MQKGLIIKSTGNAFGVRLSDGNVIEAHVKGNFRIRGIRSTSPVAVGDHVEVEQQEDGTNWIVELYDRKNYIVRRSTNLSKQTHILAANVDQVALIVTVNHPRTSLTFIDRFLATAEAYRVPAVLIFNKVDLLNSDELEELSYYRVLYESLGYTTRAICATRVTHEAKCQVEGVPDYGSPDDIRDLFAGKTTLLSGNSGVGKSTLLNALVGQEVTRTGLISSAHDKGMHTTTFSEMYMLSDEMHETAIIDTPGIKGFGTFDMQREEVSHYFKDIFAASAGCRFGNCTHTTEPGCNVLAELEAAHLAPSRYESYLSILSECDTFAGDKESSRREKRYR